MAGRERDPFRSSVLAQAAGWRLAALGIVICCLWLAVVWAVSLE